MASDPPSGRFRRGGDDPPSPRHVDHTREVTRPGPHIDLDATDDDGYPAPATPVDVMADAALTMSERRNARARRARQGQEPAMRHSINHAGMGNIVAESVTAGALVGPLSVGDTTSPDGRFSTGQNYYGVVQSSFNGGLGLPIIAFEGAAADNRYAVRIAELPVLQAQLEAYEP